MTSGKGDSNMKRLNKADILRGRDRMVATYIKTLDGEVVLRPLTDGEWSEVESTAASAFSIDASGEVIDRLQREVEEGSISAEQARARYGEALKLDLDVGRFARAEYNANALAAMYGMSAGGEEWSMQDVRSLPIGATEEIAKKVLDLTGVSLDMQDVAAGMSGKSNAERKMTDEVHRFREDEGGSADTPVDSDGHPTGENPERDDPRTESVSP